MFFSSLSPREKRLFFIALAAVSLSLLYSLMIRPLSVKWRQLLRQIANKEMELKSNIRYIDQKEGAARIYRQLTGVIKKGGRDEEEMTDFLRTVEKTAKDTNLHISNIRPRPTADLAFCKKYALEMNCQATMEGYIKFIYSLQKSGQLIRVEKLKMTSLSRSSPELKARLLISKILASQ